LFGRAAVLARRYPNARIVFSGGNANLVSSDAAKEADFAMPVFESFGFAKDRLIMERRSRNTYENAKFSNALVSPKSGEQWLLVTSAHHMPRSFARSDLKLSRIRSTGERAGAAIS
jgi:uncharacterized SAM-binding protein YcdF (DUF218 family)